jgi:hypothetical protein
LRPVFQESDVLGVSEGGLEAGDGELIDPVEGDAGQGEESGEEGQVALIVVDGAGGVAVGPEVKEEIFEVGECGGRVGGHGDPP